MKIGYISYEHPLGISGGGIGTYLGQIAKIMAERGHAVHVFTGHTQNTGTLTYNGYVLHRVKAANVGEFRQKVVDTFATANSTAKFDIIESGEYGADAFFIKTAFADIPLTLKLHTPTFLVSRLNNRAFNWFQKGLFLAKCLGKGIIQKPFWVYDKTNDLEYRLFLMANSVSSPSNSLKGIVGKEWGREKEIAVVPLPFQPPAEFLAMPPATKPQNKTVICFIGKLEIRKGILDLMKAIPEVLKQTENVIFRFIGEPLLSPHKGLNMQEYITSELGSYRHLLQFTGKQAAESIPALLTDVQICIFPSLWENFPNVCLESMAAGKLVIGTNNGGMADMITHGRNGLLVEPNSPGKLARLIIGALQGDYNLEAIGKEARQRILSAYNRERIGKLTEDFYRETVRKGRPIPVFED